MSSSVTTQTLTESPSPVNLDEVRDLLIQARNENLAVNEQIPHAVELVKLGQDTGHLKLIVYGLAACMVILLATAWQLFLFLDGKIERKTDYLNSRLDTVIQINQADIPEPPITKIDTTAAKKPRDTKLSP